MRVRHKEKDPVTGKTINFIVGEGISKKRATSMWRKEKGTIAWLRTMTEPEDNLIDVGANVGVYSLFAAVVMDCRVWALEPESQNFARLNQNIKANRMSGHIWAYPLAASDETGPAQLKVGRLILGHSGHQIHRRTKSKPDHLQGSWEIRIDDLNLRPTHVKVDVDGDEPRVMAGMAETLENPRLRSVQIEINLGSSDHIGLDAFLRGYDFQKYETETTRTNGFENWRWQR
jgi:FkbM family methyltransferase